MFPFTLSSWVQGTLDVIGGENSSRDENEGGRGWSPKRWNYRVVLVGEDEWQIREVYYDENDVVVGWTGNAAALWGESEAELAAVVRRILEAFDLPSLVESELPGFTYGTEDGSFDDGDTVAGLRREVAELRIRPEVESRQDKKSRNKKKVKKAKS